MPAKVGTRSGPGNIMNATLRNLSLVGRQHRYLIVVLVTLALIAQWVAVAVWITGGALHFADAAAGLIALAALLSLVIMMLGGALYIVLGHVRSSEKELARIATTDLLTGVLNRRGFMGAAGQEFTRSARYDRQLSFLAVDIDGFKAVNDTHGQGAGDAVLQAFTIAWQSVLRTTDTVGRTGGEEFTILLPETDSAQAFDLAERVRQACERVEFDFLPAGQAITVSVGVASVRTGDSSIEHALARADDALHRAKGAGRNRVEIV